MDKITITTHEQFAKVHTNLPKPFLKVVKYCLETENKDLEIDVILNCANEANVPKHLLLEIVSVFKLKETNYNKFCDEINYAVDNFINKFEDWKALESESIR